LPRALSSFPRIKLVCFSGPQSKELGDALVRRSRSSQKGLLCVVVGAGLQMAALIYGLLVSQLTPPCVSSPDKTLCRPRSTQLLGARSASCRAHSIAATPSPPNFCCCTKYAAKENYHRAQVGQSPVYSSIPANLAQWTATATLFRDVACLPFGCLDLNVSS
jgi:hypothetical protein